MTFLQPQWLLLLPLLALAGWRWPVLRFHEPLRVLALLMLVLLLAGMRIQLPADGMDLWVLLDRSDSARSLLASEEEEIFDLLESSRGRDDRINRVEFADVVQWEDENTEGFSGDGKQSRIALAVKSTLARIQEGRTARFLLLSDGYSTEPVDRVIEELRTKNVVLDTRILIEGVKTDFWVSDLELPTRIQSGESFLLTGQIRGTKDQEVSYEVLRGDSVVFRGQVRLSKGVATIRLTDRLLRSGSYQYRLRINADDAVGENNYRYHWVEVEGTPQVLLLTSFSPDPVEETLRSAGIQVRTIRQALDLDMEDLSGVSAVVINNVAAHMVSTSFLDALPFYVQTQGGGLLMLGGRHSFGAGGYFSSKIDPLLPVSMELRKEHRQLAVAMSIIMDRSGSMAAAVPAGGRRVSKMDLANEGAARTIQLLGEMDSISVFAVDSTAHEILPQSMIGKKRDRLIHRVSRVQSMGGGIFVYEGLRQGWEELKKAEQGQRHMILFSDAADSEQPGEYIALLDEMSEAGATVSVIGLGQETDADADFLKDIAKRGGGRIFFNQNPGDLPALFAQETVTVARSAFLDDPVAISGTPGWRQIAGGSMSWPESVDGYNLSYLRPDATAAVISGDEYDAPLVAFWNRGTGRSAAVSFSLSGKESGMIRSWEGYGDFIQTLIRWLQANEIPTGLSLQTNLMGNVLQIDFRHSEEWSSKLADMVPRILVGRGEQATVEEVPWELMRPGHYSASVTLGPEEWLRGAVNLGEISLPFGPIINGANAEWSRDRLRQQEVYEISRKSGGREILDLSSVWSEKRNVVLRHIDRELMGCFLIFMLLDALFTRLDVSPGRYLWRVVTDYVKSR
ncbi:MAG: vWA domain-containing protein [Verrucomicrobiota bacterium]